MAPNVRSYSLPYQYFGVGIIPWSPLARGFVARPLGQQQTVRGGCDIVEEVAKKMNISMAQVAIAWTLQKDGVTAPIVGTTSLDNLKDIIAGVQVKLSEEDVQYLEELYQPQAIIGHA
ncbi:hypothetical protein FRC00_004615 [Tulasnella sp. 408]|nr:hypothetical protein FRC00_004615 [Tulasnella sp. 408]